MPETNSNTVDKQPDLIQTLKSLRDDILQQSDAILQQYNHMPEQLRDHISARNLSHYLALRRHDLRQIQHELTELGVSSLDHCEAHVLFSLNQVIAMLEGGYQASMQQTLTDHQIISRAQGVQRLEQNCADLFRKSNPSRYSRVMVTLPTEAASDPDYVYHLIEHGMDCARINCIHDNEVIWMQMIQHIRTATEKSGKDCAILMDLAGQKLRTLLPAEKQKTLKLKPEKQDNIQQPASLLLYADHYTEFDSSTRDMPKIQIPSRNLRQLRAGDRLRFYDAHRKKRILTLVERTDSGHWIASCDKTAYISPVTKFKLQRQRIEGGFLTIATFCVNKIPQQPVIYRLFTGDRMLLTKDPELQHSEQAPAIIQCNHPDIIDALKPGHQAWFDDGKIGTIVEDILPEGALLRVTHAGPNGNKLRTEKGMNLPDTPLEMPSLTEKDLKDLDFICQHADMVGYSFVETAEDMRQLQQALVQRNATDLAIVAKIETKVAVKNLPAIIYSALPDYKLSIMIARGDLAVELGGARMAEIQEELLWLCEAAHIPVIWATQVLEKLAKKGLPSRPELTDAAMSGRAECVMLNKGPYILQALTTLTEILERMQQHQNKRRNQFRALHW